jgi:GTP-binding protein
MNMDLGTIIVLNKWDENMETFQKMEEEIRRRFRFLSYAPIIAVSAKTGRSIERLKEKIIEILITILKEFQLHNFIE